MALLIGILIFSEVSDSIICPAPVSGPPAPASFDGFDNLGSLGSLGDALYITDIGVPEIVDQFVTTPGIMGNAIINNGSGDGNTDSYVRFGTIPSTWNFMHTGNVGSNLTSINMWVNGDFDGSTRYPVLGNYPAELGGASGIAIVTELANVKTYIREDNAQIDVSSQPPIPADDGQWHMVTWVYDKGNTTSSGNSLGFVCMDGGSCTNLGIAQLNFDGGVADPTFNLTASARKAVGSGSLDNTIMNDEITIWNGWILTKAEITTMWNGGSGSSSASIASGAQVLRVTFDSGTELNPVGGGGSGSTGLGNLECEGAKDTAWTVIGILPVALFFALFAIFGALGRTE